MHYIPRSNQGIDRVGTWVQVCVYCMTLAMDNIDIQHLDFVEIGLFESFFFFFFKWTLEIYNRGRHAID